MFFKKNNKENFYSNFISLNDSDYIPENHTNLVRAVQRDEWNHLVFLRMFRFLNISNLSLIEKKITRNNLKRESSLDTIKPHKHPLIIKLIDNIISKFAFRFNKVIFESFYFPKKEYIKICLRCKLIPSKYLSFFDFQIKKNSLSKENNSKRIKLKNLLANIENQDKFIQFLLLNIYKDMPKSYLENFSEIKKKILPIAKEKKIIFSMYSLVRNDNFKIYIAETKKVGSKYIHVEHGAGYHSTHTTHFFDFFEKVSDKIIIWDNTKQKQDIYVNLSPIFPTIKSKYLKTGNNCSIIFVERARYKCEFKYAPTFDQTISMFNELTQFVNKLNPEIKSKVKFRAKANMGLNSENLFLEMFGKNSIDEVSLKNTFDKTMLNSKLLIITYPETAFSQAMYSNVPTILIVKKNNYLFSKTALNTFDELKKSKIAFDDFDEARIHINRHWEEIDLWWKQKNVQSAKEMFLTNFCNVKSDWFKEWSDYIYSSKKL